jgi:hypothetical protein
MNLESKNIYVNYLKILRKIRNFMLSKKSREFLIFLFFVALSTLFWLLQVLNNDYETDIRIPLRMKNVPQHVVVTEELPEALTLHVKDRGTVLAGYLWGKTFLPLALDFKELADEQGGRVRLSADELAKRVAGQLNQSTKLLSVAPDSVCFTFTSGKAKRLPVRLAGSAEPERQYYIADTRLQPDSVVVYAPKAILDTLTAAWTQPVRLDHLSDSTRLTVPLAQVRGAKFVPASVDVTWRVDVYSEKTLEVPVVGINFPADKMLRTFPAKVQVTFQVGLQDFKRVTADDFLIGVSYEDLLRGGQSKCKPVIKATPKCVNHARISPQEVDYLIEQKLQTHD